MRELKCRAKVKWNGNHFFAGDWVEGFYAYKELTDEHVILVERANMNRPGSYFTEVEVIPETVGQYTPYRDITGENICEGDIIHFTVFDHNGADTQYKGVVKFAHGRWQIWKSKGNEYYGSDGAFDLDWVVSQDDETEIIGNVTDNPELLEGKHD